jgi:hypothetical protein
LFAVTPTNGYAVQIGAVIKVAYYYRKFWVPWLADQKLLRWSDLGGLPRNTHFHPGQWAQKYGMDCYLNASI